MAKERRNTKEFLKKYLHKEFPSGFGGTAKYINRVDCDICGANICQAYDFDLQGSYFYCYKCVAEVESGE